MTERAEQRIDYNRRNSDSYDPIDDFGNDMFKIDIVKYINLILKWWWIPLILIGISMAVAKVLVDRTTPVYQASTVIEIKQKESNVLDVDGVEQITANNEYLVTQIALLKSTTLIKRVVENLNLHSDPLFANQSDSRESRLEQATSRFASRLDIGPVGRTRLIKISFEDIRPQMTVKAADSMAQNFISYNLERRFEATAYAREFVQNRLASTKATLEDSERSLAQYAEDKQILDLSSGRSGGMDNQSESLSGSVLFTLNEQLTEAQSNRIILQQRYEKALQNKQTEAITNNPIMLALTEKKRELTAEYQEKLQILKPDFPSMKEIQAKIDVLDQQIAAQSNDLLELVKFQYEEAKSLEKSLQQRLEAAKGSIRQERNDSIDYNILLREVDTNRTQYEGLLQRLKELSITDGIGPNLVSVVDTARIPKKPVRPDLIQALLLAFVLGSILSTALIVVLEVIDNRIKEPSDVTSRLKIPLLGVVPVAAQGQAGLAQLEDPTSSVSEAYASIRTNVTSNLERNKSSCLHITSTRGSEGKSFVVSGLAKSFANTGHKTLIIDSDMRKPAFTWPRDKTIGLSGLLRSRKRLADEIIPTKDENLYLLPCGEKPKNPTSLISSRRFVDLVSEARNNFDVVIIDSPPILGLADAPGIGSLCDSTIFVIEYSGIRTPMAQSALGRLRSSHVNVLGAVLNKYKSPTNQYMDYYYYSYGDNSRKYGQTETTPKSNGIGAKIKSPFQKKRREKLDLFNE